MKLNNKGFAISGILYSMLILVITLMFLVLGILAGRRTTLNKIGQEAKASIEDRIHVKLVCTSIDFSTSQEFSYTGSEEKFTAQAGTYYLIQAWGGAGAKVGSYSGGNGAYASAIYMSDSSQILYINVGAGGDAILNLNSSTYNGGGAPNNSGTNNSGAGGGATSIATRSGLLSTLNGSTTDKNSIILVAAGGGGAGSDVNGGYGGNLTTSGSSMKGSTYGAKGATATAGGTSKGYTKSSWLSSTTYSGTSGSFGAGGKGSSTAQSKYAGGGGSGYYGGGGGAISSNNGSYYGTGGGGGISYIRSDVLSTSQSVTKNGGIFSSKSVYIDYVGVGISGDDFMPEPKNVGTDAILSSDYVEGNTKSGYVLITKMTCVEQ